MKNLQEIVTNLLKQFRAWISSITDYFAGMSLLNL